MAKAKYYTSWENMPLFLDIAALSILIGKSYESTRQLVQHGKIPAVKVGAEWRISKEEIRKFLTKEETA